MEMNRLELMDKVELEELLETTNIRIQNLECMESDEYILKALTRWKELKERVIEKLVYKEGILY